mgnify:CR=1 FL=1
MRRARGSGLSSTRSTPAGNQLAYEDSVREAPCFGWIDSLVNRLDDDLLQAQVHAAEAYEQVVGPRNRKRWAELKAAGLLAAAALQRRRLRTVRAETQYPGAARLCATSAESQAPKAWDFFQTLARNRSTARLWFGFT